MKQLEIFDIQPVWDFKERLAFSEGIDCEQGIFTWVLDSIPGAVEIQKANLSQDKNGTDFWIMRTDGLRPLSIDLKNRDFCPMERFGSDDACIETTSVYRGPNDGQWQDSYRHKIGWTLNGKKQTDYIIYTWPTNNGQRRFWIVPFPFLCSASQRNWQAWAKVYGERAAINNTYLTLSIFPPRSIIAGTMKTLMIGRI